MRLLLVLLVVGAFASQEVMDQIKQFDSDEFGRTLIDTLQMQMSAGEPITKFIEIMRNLETSIEKEQKEDDKANKDYQAQCTDDIKVLQQDSANLERRTVEIQSILDELVPVREYKQAQKESKNEWKTQVEAKISEIVQKRNNQKSDFDQRQDENDYAVFVITTVKRTFEEKGSSFLQSTNVGSIFTQVKDYFINASNQSEKFKIKKSFTRIFTVMAQIAASAQSEDLNNSPTVKKILNLCDQLLRNIEDTRASELKAEQNRLQLFTFEKQLLDKDLSKLNNALAQLEADILQLNNRITDLTNDLNDYNTRLSQKNQQGEDRTNECREKAYNYQLTREKRDSKRQLSILNNWSFFGKLERLL
ncbi:hypothetical protein pb186bvf_001019 [Paramecium bursaria]